MASEKLVKQLLAINFSLHPSSAPADITAAHVVAKFWMQALAPFEDAEVEPIATRALESSTFPLKPADIVPKLACARLGVIPWEEAYAEVCDLIDMRDGSFRRSPDSPQKRVADRMLSALQARTGEGSHALRAQFRDAYHAEVERMIDEEREPGGVLAIGSSNGVKAIEAQP